MSHAPAPPPIGLAAWLGLSIAAAATIVLGLQRPDEAEIVARPTGADRPIAGTLTATRIPVDPAVGRNL